MHISAPFIRRPVATALLSVAILMAGGVAFYFLPVAALPRVDFPTIYVRGGLPGASPETMASAVATPLERQFGRIAGITEMTSSSQLGSTGITLQFDLDRDINAASRDVQAAINAAAGQLPANLPSLPTYRRVNPSDPDIMDLSVFSDTIPRSRLYDLCDSILGQKLSQVDGVGQVGISGGAKPAVRVDLNPNALAHYGIGLEEVRAALRTSNANTPKGNLEDQGNRWVLFATDQLLKADQYVPLIVAYRNGAPVRLSDIARVTEGIEDIRNSGYANGKPSVNISISRQPGANIIKTVDNIKAILPELRASIPPAATLDITSDRTITIRASVHDIEFTLMLTVALVVMVIFMFLRNAWATMIPSISVPLSIVGTFGVMYLLHYSIDNLSLMALAICTGFVVDDAIVVIENITRFPEAGGPERFPRNWLHRFVHERFADGRVYSHPSDGRHRRQALQGVRRHVERGDCRFSLCFPHDYADDVRQIPEIGEGQKTREAVPGNRTRVSTESGDLRDRLALGPPSPDSDARGDGRHDLLERLLIYRRSKGIFPAARYGAHEREHPGCPGSFVPGHAGQIKAIQRNRIE